MPNRDYPVLHIYDALDPTKRGEALVYIYFLCDQADGRPRYVGKTVRPYDRLREHWCRYASVDAHGWIRELKASGRRLRMCVLEIVPSKEGSAAEKRWAEHLWDQGEDLLNQMMLMPKRWERQIDGFKRGRLAP